jgi:hypothetical protein
MSGGCGVRGGFSIDRLPLQELLGTEVRADRAFGLAKVYEASEAFLRHEPAAATDMLQIETSFKARLFSLSADPNGLRGQPGGDLIRQ